MAVDFFHVLPRTDGGAQHGKVMDPVLRRREKGSLDVGA